jgi:hypothetical protein
VCILEKFRLVLLFDNNWCSDGIIYGCLSSLAKNLPILNFARGVYG